MAHQQSTENNLNDVNVNIAGGNVTNTAATAATEEHTKNHILNSQAQNFQNGSDSNSSNSSSSSNSRHLQQQINNSRGNIMPQQQQQQHLHQQQQQQQQQPGTMNEKIKSPSGQGGGSNPSGAPPNNSNEGQISQQQQQQQPPQHHPPYGDSPMSHYQQQHHHLHQQHQQHQQQQQQQHQQQQHQQHHMPQQQPGSGVEMPAKDDGHNTYTPPTPPLVGGVGPPPPPGPPPGHHPSAYGRYHHGDPNMDPYRYGHSPMQPIVGAGGGLVGPLPGGGGGGKPQSQQQQQSQPQQQQQQQQQPPPPPPPSGISSPNRPPPQRYIPGQPPQGPTPTLNSLLQSHPPPPPPPQHRYSNSYDPQQQQGSQQQQPQPQQQQHPPPPPPHQPYGGQQGWAPPPRPYSPQLGPSQAYRTPPPSNTSRGQSPYPPAHGQNSGSYPSSPQQQPGGPPPPPPQSSAQGSGTSQYSPYPQRYPTPPGPASGPNHRTAYSTHQYPEPNRPWPGGTSPAASPGPGGHPHPPASPHQPQHSGPPPNSPGHAAPSPSPQPSQASPSPHQELIGQNSNDSSSGGGVSGIGSGPPGTPNPQQVMRPTPSPTGSSGSRSMSPAVAQNLPISRPSSNQSQSGQQMPPTTASHMSHSSSASIAAVQQQSQPPGQSSITAGGSSQQQQQQQQQQSPASQQQQQQQPTPPNQSVNNMPTQGSYQTQPPPISHMHGYKMGPGSGQSPGPGPQNMPPYPPPPQSQQYSQGNYPPRPQYPSSYAPTPPTNQPSSANSMPPGPNQYPGRPLPNHSGTPHTQFPPYQQNWVPPSPQGHAGMMGNHVQNKGTPPPPPQANVVGSPRPLNYLKQHLQHKGSYVGGSSPTPPQGYGNGPAGMHLPMGPPHHMGPPHGPTNMGPPTSGPQPVGGPPSTQVPIDGNSTPDHSVISQDNGITSSGSSTASAHPVTSVVTTGPDGTPLDEASQQSTLSNASAASGEDPQCTTPKSRKNDPYSQSHLAPPSTSPGGHPHNEDFEMNSPPNWSRTPASPQVFNSHVPQESYRTSTKKSDSLCKLYDMDDNPDRRGWLDKLLSFMEERRTPITACPTISKQPLDLYRLYIYVKERGGFVEVTKSKTWKDIAGLLGIGASSSAAYTLRKHYTKNLLAFECHFDRGDIDPLPIIQQVEAGSKKKSAKATSVPSPAGSSNSQDSFPAPVAANTSIDGYPGYPSGYPAGAQPDYNAGAQIQRPPSQTNAQTPHAGNTQATVGDNISVSNPFDDPVGAPPRAPYQQGSTYPPVSRSQGSPYPGQPGYNQYGSSDQYNSSGPPGQFTQSQGQFPPQNRTMYPPYGPEGEAPSPAANTYGPYGSRPYTQPPPGASQTTAPPGGSTTAPSGPPTGAGATPSTYPPAAPQQPDYYRPPEQSPQPRRHPDFVKDSQGYAGYNQRPQMYGGWQGGAGQYRGQYPSSPTPQGWCTPPRTSGPPPPPNQQTAAQWDQHRYPPQNQPPYPANQQQPWTNMSSPQQNPGSPLRPPPQRMPGGSVVGPSGVSNSGSGKPPFNMPPPQPNASSAGGPPSGPTGSIGAPPGVTVTGPSVLPGTNVMASGSKATPPPPQPGPFPPAAQMQKKDIVFPPDSVESTAPVLYRRKRLAKSDVCPIDPWRIFMALRSGLLSESTWALDILNILLYDDSTVQYFGLAHLPGLLSLLLEHFQKNLAEMFDNENTSCVTSISSHSKSRHYENNADEDCSFSVDLGQLMAPTNPEEKVLLLSNTPNYTMISRKNMPVRIQNAEDDIFVSDHLKAWDYDSNRNYQLTVPIGSDAWTYGHIERDPHDGVIDVFKSEIIDIPFARYIGGGKGGVYGSRKDKLGRINDHLDNDEEDAGEDDEEISSKVLTFNKKRRHISMSSTTSSNNNKNGLSGAKKSKLNFLEGAIGSGSPATLTIKTEVKKEEPEELISEQSSDSVTKTKDNLLLDSDCREVDMDIEHPRMLSNGAPPSTAKRLCFDPKSSVRDPAMVLQRRRMSGYEDECYTRDEASLYLVNESQDSLARRCICLSNIFRNLTFVPGNETILAKSSKFLALLGKLLLLNHEHLLRTPKTRNYDREEDTDFSDSCSSLHGEKEWWWDYLITIRENMLVAVANIAGHLELSRYEEIITRPVLDGLLHWAVCPSAHGQDPFPSCGPNSALSPQRLALEALCKLCVTDANVDLVIATPPHSRLEKLCAVLTRHLCRNEDQVLREFSVNLLHYLAAADSAMARTVALQSPCISYLVAFIEQAEQTALGVANQHGINYLRENPDSMGTSLDMLRRAAGTLLHLSRHPDNRSLFMQQEQRLLGLVMSHILDQQVALIISRVLFQVSRGPGPMPSMEYRLQQRQQAQQQQNDNNKTAESRKLQQQQQQTPVIVVEGAADSCISGDAGGNAGSGGGGGISGIGDSSTNATATAANFSSSNVHNSNSNSSSSSSSNSSLTCNKSEDILVPPSATLNDISNSSNSSCGSSNSSNITAPIGVTAATSVASPSSSSTASSSAGCTVGATTTSQPLLSASTLTVSPSSSIASSSSATAAISAAATTAVTVAAVAAAATTTSATIVAPNNSIENLTTGPSAGVVVGNNNKNSNISTTTATITGNSSNNNSNNSSNSNNSNITATTTTTAAVA